MTGERTTAGTGDELGTGRPQDPPLSLTRLLGALILACVLFFVMLIVFAFAGLGQLGLFPAIVVAVAFTGRIAHIRRLSVLIAIGVLSFVIMVVFTYAVAIAVIMSNPQLQG